MIQKPSTKRGKFYSKCAIFFGAFVIIISLFPNASALAATPIYVRPGGSDAFCNGTVDADYSGSNGPDCAAQTINQGINLVDLGGTVNIGAGIYTENIDINKWVSIIGAGSGSDSASNTILRKLTNNPVVTLSASGNSASEPVILQDLRIEPVNVYGFWIPGSISDLVLENVHVIGSDPRDNSESEVGLWVTTTASVNRWSVSNSAFDHTTYGWYFQKNGDWGPGGSNITNLNVTNTSFSHNGAKGAYIEKISDASFDAITVHNNGIDTAFWNATWNAGFDLNLKGEESYKNLNFSNCTFSDNGLDVTQGAGLLLKARDDGSTYGAHPANLSNVTVSDCSFSGNERAIRIGEPGGNNATPTDVVVKGNNFDSDLLVFDLNVDGNNLIAYANNAANFIDAGLTSSVGTFNARHNWWGTHATQPTGVDSDSWAYRLGAPMLSWADGSAGDATSGNISLDSASNAGIVALVNHGSGTAANVPFGKGTNPYQTQVCSDYYDVFIVSGGSGNYTVNLIVDDNAPCRTDIGNPLENDALFFYNLLVTSCTPDPGCFWNQVTGTSHDADSLSATIDASFLNGTPFVAGSPGGPYDPTAISLQEFNANGSRSITITATLSLGILFAASIITLRRWRS